LACRRNGFSACGGLLRDAHGGLIQSFYCNLGRNNSQGAEMWSLVHAMRIARHLRVDRVIFETDSNLVATAVLNSSTTISYLKPLLEEVLNLLQLQDWSANIQHCFREANSCADLLAKKGFDAPFSPVLVNSNCQFLHALLVLDCNRFLSLLFLFL